MEGGQRGKVRKLIRNHKDLFTYGRLGHVPDHGEMEINLNDETPTVSRMYRMTPSEREWLDLEIQRLLELQVITPSKSPYSSPVVLVKKRSTTSDM